MLPAVEGIWSAIEEIWSAVEYVLGARDRSRPVRTELIWGYHCLLRILENGVENLRKVF